MFDWTKTDITMAVIDLQSFYSCINDRKRFVTPKVNSNGETTKEVFEMNNSLVFVIRYYTDKEKRVKELYNNIKRVEMQVSLHKYFAEGFNYSDFQFKDLFKSVASICLTYGINPFKAVLLNIEAGYNVTPTIRTDAFLIGLYFFKTVPFEAMKNKFRFKVGLEATLCDYVIKCYNKRSQLQNTLRLEKEILRYEVHFNVMRKVNDCGIYCLADLLDNTKVYKLSKLVLSTLEELVYFEPQLQKLPLSTPDKKLINEWKNPKEIATLMKNNSQRYRRQRRRYNELSSQIDTSTLKQIKKAIHAKEKELLQLDYKTIKQAKFFLSNYKK